MKEFLDEYLTDDVMYDLEVKSFGRIMGVLVEKYVIDMIENNTGIEVMRESDQNLNRAGYDIKTKNGIRIQVKFRQTKGKTPFSCQTYFSTTRRHSAMNLGYAARSGQIAYRKDEFDCVIVVLCPHSEKYGKESRHPDNWRFSCIDVRDIIDQENPDFCELNIKANLLEKGKEWDKILMKLDKESSREE